MSKIILVTHEEDLDGKACAILANFIKEEGPEENELIIKYATYKNIDDIVVNLIETGTANDADYFFITDIAPKKKVVYEIIDDFVAKGGQLKILDHHELDEFVTGRPYVTSDPFLTSYEEEKLEDTGAMKSCGTFRFFCHLEKENLLDVSEAQMSYLVAFVETVRRHDTYEWKDIFSDNRAPELNALFAEMPNFVEHQIEKIRNIKEFLLSDGLFNDAEEAIVNLGELKREKYIQETLPRVLKYKFNEYLIAVVFGRKIYASPLGHAMLAQSPECDMAMIIDMEQTAIALRTTKDDINLRRFAKQFGGGGHPKASGITFTHPDDTWKFYKIIRDFDIARRNSDKRAQRKRGLSSDFLKALDIPPELIGMQLDRMRNPADPGRGVNFEGEPILAKPTDYYMEASEKRKELIMQRFPEGRSPGRMAMVAPQYPDFRFTHNIDQSIPTEDVQKFYGSKIGDPTDNTRVMPRE